MRKTMSAAGIVAFLMTCACGRDATDEASNTANAADRQVVPQAPIPVLQPALTREQLILAAIRAASDFAGGIDDSKRQKALAGKKFEFRARFGCDAPDGKAEAGPFGWSFDKEARTLKVRATLSLSGEDSPVKSLSGENVEAVEGFWLRRPWMLAASCPRPVPVTQPAGEKPAKDEPAKQAPAPVIEPAETRQIGIAQFFSGTDPRTLRRSGRPYQATEKLDEDDTPTGGFDLVLTGRLKALADGRVIACTSATGGPPACVISVEFGRVSIERADTNAELAHWGAG